MRPGQGQRRGGRRNDNRHGGHGGGHGGNGGGHRSNQGGQQGQNRSAQSLRNQIFDSNGPDMRVRGNAFQVHEKYQALAKDALSSGDRVLAENYLQHAEHYFRIIEAINEATAAEQRARQASWENQPQPQQYADGQQGEGQPQDGQPQDQNGYAGNSDGQYQANGQQGQQQGNGQGNGQNGGQQNFRRDRNRDGYNNRNQQRYNPDNRGNQYDQQQPNQTQGQAEYQPQNQQQQPSGQTQDPLYDGVDEDIESPDTQAAVGGRR